MLDVRRLRLLYELSHRGTIAATARALDYTPSAVSQQLSALEREAGVVLLERDGRRVTLTPAALALVRRARRILDELDAAEADLRATDATVQGEVWLGAFPSAVPALILPAARALARRHPGVRVDIHETDPEPGMRLLRSGSIDILVGYQYDLLTPLSGGGTQSVHLVEDPVLAVVPAGHWAAAAAVDLADLADEPWVAGLPGTPFGALVQRACRVARFEPRIAHRAREFSVQQAIVAAGLGVALLPGLSRTGDAAQADQVRFLQLRSPPIVRHVQAHLRRGSQRRPAVGATLAELTRAGAHVSVRGFRR